MHIKGPFTQTGSESIGAHFSFHTDRIVCAWKRSVAVEAGRMRSEPAFAWSLKGLCYQNGGRRGEARTQSEPIGCASEKEHPIGCASEKEHAIGTNRLCER
ncbi:hypothetical protein PYW08_002004 [Mythimna loreyi]|uniref:Uncharacterized protein n=1 Tax=Mythimna loreyi TaxID=667449 RepID=A0ACC2R0I4_9NEOP|nr:hypothetical protein PYW08_002004 [Mythimna loreyi]